MHMGECLRSNTHSHSQTHSALRCVNATQAPVVSSPSKERPPETCLLSVTAVSRLSAGTRMVTLAILSSDTQGPIPSAGKRAALCAKCQ